MASATTPKSNNPFDAAVVANGVSVTMQQIVAAQNANAVAQTPRTGTGNTSNDTQQSNTPNNSNNTNNNNTGNNTANNTSNSAQATSPLALGNMANLTAMANIPNVTGSSASLDLTSITGFGGLTSLRSTSADSLRSNSTGALTPTALNTFSTAGLANLPALCQRRLVDLCMLCSISISISILM